MFMFFIKEITLPKGLEIQTDQFLGWKCRIVPLIYKFSVVPVTYLRNFMFNLTILCGNWMENKLREQLVLPDSRSYYETL